MIYASCIQQDVENINGIWEKIRRYVRTSA